MGVTVGRALIIIAVCALCTQLERALPFLLFAGRPVPRVVRYLGDVLPPAVMATLVVYCVRDMSFITLSGFAPRLIALAVTCLLHLWKRNTMLSILIGTACYMLLVQRVF